ncbi:hypothetical protein J6590_104108 [Homalodisca vitripennis]|nr:hypothetical protein J6590_104108 [Homalodisca vitripennis]
MRGTNQRRPGKQGSSYYSSTVFVEPLAPRRLSSWNLRTATIVFVKSLTLRLLYSWNLSHYDDCLRGTFDTTTTVFVEPLALRRLSSWNLCHSNDCLRGTSGIATTVFVAPLALRRLSSWKSRRPRDPPRSQRHRGPLGRFLLTNERVQYPIKSGIPKS